MGTEPSSRTGAADDWLTPGRFGLLLGSLIFAMFPRVLWGSATFIFRDFGMFGYPLAYFHRESFWRGELPLWNPLSSCGLPFLAQWNTLTLYPGSLIYLLLPLGWSLPFFCLAHLFWGGLGMYILAYRWTQHRLGAGLAGVIFAFNGLSLNALMWPNIEATLGWLPWVIWLGQRGWREGGRTLVWAALAGAMQMLAGGPEPILFTWLILLVLVCSNWLSGAADRARIFFRFCLLGLLVALVCAAQLLPFLELLAHSQRDRDYSASAPDWCMPFWGWANFLVPLFRTAPTAQGVFLQNGQYWTSSYYAGIGTVLLAAVGVWRVRDWRVGAAAALALLGLVLALGDSTLLYRGLQFCFPGLGFVRYPVKFVILVLALAPLLAAFGFAALTRGTRPAGRFEVVAVLLMVLLVGGIVAVDSNSPLAEDAWRATWQSGLSRVGFLGLAVLFGMGLLASEGRRRIALGFVLVVLFWLDLATHAPTQNPGANPSVYAPGWARARLKLEPEPELGGSRVMLLPEALDILRRNPTASLEETYLRNRLAIRVNCNLLDELPQIDGFFSLTPREVARVAALPYDQPNHALAGLLDFLGVSQTTVRGSTCDWAPRPTAMPIVTAGQQPVFANDQIVIDAFFQTNTDLRRIVFLPTDARRAISVTQRTAARVLKTAFASQKIVIQTEATAPSLVVIAQTYYPAWKARVDGQPARIWRANCAFQAVQVPAGRHELQLLYEDQPFLIGVLLSVLGLAGCLALWLMARSRSNGTRLPPS